MPREDEQLSDNGQQSDMNIVIIIDKKKLPEALRDKFPQDLQNKLIELLQEEEQDSLQTLSKEQDSLQTLSKEQDSLQTLSKEQLQKDEQYKRSKWSNLFSVQQGTVVGNIYRD